MTIDFRPLLNRISSLFTSDLRESDSGLWAKVGTYPPRHGNDLQILIDGQAAYGEIEAAFHHASKFIYMTISFGDWDFLLVPENGETMLDILRLRRKDNVDVRLVVWQPESPTPDTIPDPAPTIIPGINDGPGSIQARWDKARGYRGEYCSPRNHFEPFPVDFPAELGCHHQKTYVMDDGADGFIAFVGGINPVQAYWDTPQHDSLDARRVERGKDLLKGLEEVPPLHDIFYKIKGPAAGDVLANFVERFNGASIRFFRTFDEPRLALCRRGGGRYKGVKLWRPRVAGYGTADIVAGCGRSRSGSVEGSRARPARHGLTAGRDGQCLSHVSTDLPPYP